MNTLTKVQPVPETDKSSHFYSQAHATWQITQHFGDLLWTLSIFVVCLFVYAFIYLFIYLFIYVFINSLLPNPRHSFSSKYMICHLPAASWLPFCIFLFTLFQLRVCPFFIPSLINLFMLWLALMLSLLNASHIHRSLRAILTCYHWHLSMSNCPSPLTTVVDHRWHHLLQGYSP